jgi:hypothetical protein
MVDPRREGERLLSTLKDEGFLVFLGLGGAYAVEAALDRPDISRVLAIEYDLNGVAELFCGREYAKILGDSRFSLLVDPAPPAIEAAILDRYWPALYRGIRTFPLRARIEQDIPRFNAAAGIIQASIEKVSSDYSVQAHFGARWFSNIIRNLKTAGSLRQSAAPVRVAALREAAAHEAAIREAAIREAAICAAGPSLDSQLALLAERKAKQGETFIISADTALPALLDFGIEPDAVVSIDCQHISYYHFIGRVMRNIPLFLDIASPPLLAGLSPCPFFFSGGHPLALYISREWRPLPRIDTSGGNVTYACLSLAESLGAKRITVYGADFSYPRGRVYARGTYIYPFFEKKQNRFSPLEALFSAFLYRSPLLPPEDGRGAGYYETGALRFYRKAFEEKAAVMGAGVIPEPGLGAPIQIRRRKPPDSGGRPPVFFAPGRARMDSAAFLEQYRQAVAALPVPGPDIDQYRRNLNAGGEQVFTTLLPLAAALKHRRPELKTGELIEAVKACCAGEIERVLAGSKCPDGTK